MKYLSVLLFSLAFYLTGYTQMASDTGTVTRENSSEDLTRLIIGFTSQVEALELKDLAINSNCTKGLLTPSLYRKLPIYKDGLRPGDIITTIDGKCFENLKELSSYIKTKKEKKINIQCYSGDTVKTITTELITLEEFNIIKDEFMSQVGVKEDGTFSVSQKLSNKYIDNGDPYKYFRCEKPFKDTQWDFQQYSNLEDAKRSSTSTTRPILLALFGSYNCCSYISLSRKHYHSLIAEPGIQSLIKKRFVSVLILKPEAYTAYKDYKLQAGSPALLILNEEGDLIKSMILNSKTSSRKLNSFLEKTGI